MKYLPAFPQYDQRYMGLNKLEWYAGLAMQAIIIGNKADSSVTDGSLGMAKDSVNCAKALIKVLEAE